MPRLYLKDGRVLKITEEQSWKLVIVTFLKDWRSSISLRGVDPFKIIDIETDPKKIAIRNQSSMFDLKSYPQQSKRKTGELA